MQVLVEQIGAVGLLRYANGPAGLITTRGAAALEQALAVQLERADIGAIVLAGAGPGVFIRHADVAQILRAAAALRAGRTTPQSFHKSAFASLGRALDGAAKPVIAAIDGPCMGAGLEIALACTLRIAGSGVRAIGLPEVRIGLFPGSGGTQRLTRLIGRAGARRFILRGAVVTADEAQRLGIIDEVSPAAVERALALAAELASRSRAAVTAVMQLMRAEDNALGLERESLAFAALLRDDPEIPTLLREYLASGRALEELP